jgi:hypothetical protein
MFSETSIFGHSITIQLRNYHSARLETCIGPSVLSSTGFNESSLNMPTSRPIPYITTSRQKSLKPRQRLNRGISRAFHYVDAECRHT